MSSPSFVGRFRRWLAPSNLRKYRQLVDSGVLETLDASTLRYLTRFPPGSFYSSLPSDDDIHAWLVRRHRDGSPPPGGIDVGLPRQLEFLRELVPFVERVELSERPQRERRYGADNPAFGRTDATLLTAIVWWSRPKRVIEVGSGWSTAALLDAIDRESLGTRVTCIEPYPRLMRDVLRPDDLERIDILDQPVQDVPADLFEELEAGDICFLDTTHVVKPGSDVIHDIYFVLPRLRPGVLVHLHDMVWPFQGWADWHRDGRLWLENYMVGAFLQFNPRFEILTFPHQYLEHGREEVLGVLPFLARDGGGSLWLRVRETEPPAAGTQP